MMEFIIYLAVFSGLILGCVLVTKFESMHNPSHCVHKYFFEDCWECYGQHADKNNRDKYRPRIESESE